VDSSSVKASPVAGPRGFHGATKADGIKRHILADSAAILVTAVVTEANVQHRAAFPTLRRKAKRVAPTIAHVRVDKGNTGSTVATPQPPPAGSTTAAASTATTEPPSPPTQDSSSSAKPPLYSDNSTAASCSTPFRPTTGGQLLTRRGAAATITALTAILEAALPYPDRLKLPLAP